MSLPGVLLVSATEVVSGTRTPKEVQWIERRQYTDLDRLADAFGVLLSRKELRRSRGVEVLLEPPHVQLRTLPELPPVRTRELREIVRGQARKFFRADGVPLVVDAVWLAAEDGGARKARAAAAALPLIQRIEEAADRAGVKLLRIGPHGNGAECDLSLATSSARKRKRTRHLLGVLPFVAAALLSWMAVAGTYLVDLVGDDRAIRSELAQLQGPLGQISSIRTRITGFLPVVNAVRAQGPDAAWSAAYLTHLTRALPDSCYLVRLTAARDGKATIEGRALDPIALVDILARAGFENVALEGKPGETSEAGRNWYRFALTMAGPS